MKNGLRSILAGYTAEALAAYVIGAAEHLPDASDMICEKTTYALRDLAEAKRKVLAAEKELKIVALRELDDMLAEWSTTELAKLL